MHLFICIYVISVLALPSSTSTATNVDPDLLAAVMLMGFSERACRRAVAALGRLPAHGPIETEAVIAWLCEHATEPETGETEPEPETGVMPSSLPNAEERAALECVVMALGFSNGQAKAGLAATCYEPERAVDWILSHPEVEGGWVIE